MAEWKRVRLGDVCKVINGRAYSLPELLDDGKYRVLRVGNFFSSDRWYYSNMELAADKYCEKGDLLFAWSASFGPRIWDAEKVIYHYHIWKLVPDSDKVDRLWLYFWLKYSCDNLTASVHGSVMAHMTKVEMEDSMLPLPPLATQRKIAAVLGAIDDKIETNRKICANLEAQAQALFESWFVDFEPFGGKMPKDWKKGKLGDLVSRMGTGLNPRDNFKLGFGNNYYVTIKNMGGNRVFLDEKCDKVDDEAIRRINERSDLRKGDVLFSGIGTIGRTYLIDETPKNWNTSESVFNMRPRAGIPSVYLYLMLLSDSVQEYVQLNALGSAQKGIRMADLKVCPAIEPTAKVLESFCKCVEPVINTVQNHWHESDALASMRDALLPKLMSGEIDVEKVEVA